MNDEQRQTEMSRREAASSAAGALVEGDGREVEGRAIKQMLSVRIEPDLIRALRRIAKDRGESVSDLLRDAAAKLVAQEAKQLVHFYMEPLVVEPSNSASGPRVTGSWSSEDVDLELTA